MLVVHSCAHCTSVETEALGKQEVLGLVFGCGIVARGQEVMGSGMGRGRPSAKGAGSRLSTGQSPPPHLRTQHVVGVGQWRLSSYLTLSLVQRSGGVQSRGY